VLDYEAMRSIVAEPQEWSRKGRYRGWGGAGKTDGHVQDDAAWRENFKELEAYVAREGHPHVPKDCGKLGQVGAVSVCVCVCVCTRQGVKAHVQDEYEDDSQRCTPPASPC